MTNPSPPDPQNPIPERRRRPATGVTFDEMIGIIIAFSTIGTILFWSMGSKNSKLAGNFGLGSSSSNFLASNKTKETGLGFSNLLSKDSRAKDSSADVSLNQDLEAENRRLAAQLGKQETAIANVPENIQQIERSPEEERKSFSLDSGANLVPLGGVAALPALRGNSGKTNLSANIPSSVKPKKSIVDTEPGKTEPKTITPETSKPTGKTEPKAITPETTETTETTKMPEDVVPSYWAYPFVKQMSDQALVPELAKNQDFEPDTLITRAGMATLVSEAFDKQPEIKSVKKFTDVTNNNAIAKNIDKAVSTGFMQGYSDNEFRPGENIPRYQVLVTLATGLGLKPSKDADQILQQFGDSSKIPDWAKQQVAAATEAGLVVNPPDAGTNALIPEKPATRGEVAAMIHQALVKTGKLQPLESEYIIYNIEP